MKIRHVEVIVCVPGCLVALSVSASKYSWGFQGGYEGFVMFGGVTRDAGCRLLITQLWVWCWHVECKLMVMCCGCVLEQ